MLLAALYGAGASRRGCTRNDSPRDPFSAMRVRRQTRSRVRTAAGLRLALDIERNKVPRAQIVGVPAISDPDRAPRRNVVPTSARLLEVPRLSIGRGMGWATGVLAAG